MRRSRRTIAKEPGNKSSLTPRAIGVGVAALAAVPAASAATFNVTNLNDSGAGSLRQAIVDANAAAGADVVTFQSGLTGTITLTTGELSLYDAVDIQGPGEAVITVSGNNAGRVFYIYSPAATPIDVTISGLTLSNGNDSVGGAIADWSENLTLDHVVISNSDALGQGGGVAKFDLAGTLHVLNSTITGNTAALGGGIFFYGGDAPADIQDSIISNNSALGSGGGVYLYDVTADVTIARTTISGNVAGCCGGGLFLYATNGGSLTIDASTISGNTAASVAGGAFFYLVNDPLTIRSSTISGNQATNVGGIFLYSAYAPVELSFTTVSGNTASGAVGGIFLYGGNLPVNNSIIAGNNAPTETDIGGGGNFILNYSLVEDVTGANVVQNAGAIVGVSAQLGPLQNNGGPTQTMMPALASPVINAGDPAFVPPPATDQRGSVRQVGARADMGAVEVNGGTIQFSTATYNVNENAGTVTVTVTRTGGTDPATVDYATSNGSASAGADFTTAGGTITFIAGQLSATFNVPILDDTLSEGNETFNVALSNPSVGAALGATSSAVVTIVDDPTGTAQFSVSTINTTEDAGSVTVTVTRTGGTEGPLTVNYATANGTATAPSDYTSASGAITFPAGNATPQSFNVTLINDSLSEGDEMFNVNLTGAGTGSPSTASIVIAANDLQPIPTLSFFGKILFGMLSGLAGLYAIVRSRLSMILFALLFIGVAAAPPLSAAPKGTKAISVQRTKEAKGGKFKGTLLSVTKSETTLVLNMSGGVSITIPIQAVKVVDARDGKPTAGSLEQVVEGAHVTVKLKTDPSGTVKNAKIKITP